MSPTFNAYILTGVHNVTVRFLFSILCVVDQEGVPDDDECELTNLNWLTELKNVGYIQLAEGPVPDVPLTRFNKFLDELKM